MFRLIITKLFIHSDSSNHGFTDSYKLRFLESHINSFEEDESRIKRREFRRAFRKDPLLLHKKYLMDLVVAEILNIGLLRKKKVTGYCSDVDICYKLCPTRIKRAKKLSKKESKLLDRESEAIEL